MAKRTALIITGILLVSSLSGCLQQHTYVLRSPFFVTTNYDYQNPETDFDLNTLQDYINQDYENLFENGMVDILSADLQAKINSIDAPIVLANGFADTKIHAKPGVVLTLSDIEALKAAILGQYADGWGEGLEQEPFSVNNAGEDLYISLYGGPGWSLELHGNYTINPTTGTVTPQGPTFTFNFNPSGP